MSDGSKQESENGNPLPLKDFIDENHRLFAVIGVFAALSAYLSQLGRGTSAQSFGVAGSLLLFLLASLLGMYQSHQASEKVRRHESLKSFVWVIPYALFKYSLFFLSVSVILLLNNRYSDEFAGIVGSTVIYSLIFIYGTIVTTTNVYSSIPSSTNLGKLYPVSPYLAIPVTLIWIYWRWDVGAIPGLLEVGVAEAIGITTGSIIMHIALTVIFMAILVVLDELYFRARKRFI